MKTWVWVQPSVGWRVLGFSLILLVLVFVSQINFLIFHTLAEIFSILVAWSVFVILWNTKELIENKALVFVGIAYLFVGGIDLVHTLSYSGMGFLEPERGANPATQLWILARYVESISLVLFPFLFFRRVNPCRVFAVFSVITIAGLMSILYWDIFPTCYIDGIGLTAFKKAREYIICIILVAALVCLRQKKTDLDPQVYPYMVAAIVLTICAEIAFTFYVSVYGLSNLVGHSFKIISFYCIYRALIRVGLTQPQATLFNRLEQSEAKFRGMFEEHSAVMLLIDPQTGQIMNANKAAEQYYGYPLKQLLEMHIHQLNRLPQEDVARQMQLAVSRQTSRFEFQHVLADGRIRDVEVHSTPVKMKDRRILFSIVSDITERKQIREEIEEHWRKLDEIVEGLPVGIGILDTEGNIIRLNSNFIQMFGYTEKDIPTVDAWGIKAYPDPAYREKVFEQWDAHLAEAFETGRHTPSVEYRITCKNGQSKHVLVSFQPGKNQHLTTFVDITDLRNARTALQSQTQLLEGVLDSIKDVIGVIQPDYRIIKYNRAGYRLLGLTEEEVKGKTCFELLGKTTPCDICPTARTLVSRKMETIEKFIPEIDGYFICTSNPILDDTGNIKLVIEQLTDITEKKKMDENIQQAQKLEAIGTLAGGIAHDFNNILFSIIGNADLLLDDFPEKSPARKSLAQIHAGALRARALVQQILAFARQEEKKLAVIKMQPIIKEALNLLRSTIPTTIAITRDIRRDCGPVTADPNQIHQIVMNLATNAFHAMEENGGELKVLLKEVELGRHDLSDPDMNPGRYACLTVSDTGTGMDKDVVNKIFDPFFTTKGKGKGTGMGLSVVHGIVKGMNGAIQVDSEPGSGTAFHVYLPIVQKPFESRPTVLKGPVPGGTERILLVDDEEAVIGMEKQALTRLGYDVISRTNSVEALEAFRSHPDRFDLVITDMTMPRMPGDKLASEIISIRPGIPILLCTGFSHTLTDEKITSVGIREILMKPVVIKDLALKIREVLDEGADRKHPNPSHDGPFIQ
jgi:PAS domain S-box-containing protein